MSAYSETFKILCCCVIPFVLFSVVFIMLLSYEPDSADHCPKCKKKDRVQKISKRFCKEQEIDKNHYGRANASVSRLSAEEATARLRELIPPNQPMWRTYRLTYELTYQCGYCGHKWEVEEQREEKREGVTWEL